ncbi:MAG: flavin reductase family protein [Acidilobus sp.]|nr:flavin reductase family protein [Acidilobus sp.]MCG2889771.1 flavin reductase family protein [Acidilobus sp.]MCG2891111.1 flavin reductase family protein [Acidilobus sp.]
MICIDKSSRSHQVLVEAQHFIVTLLSSEDEWVSRVMAEPGGPAGEAEEGQLR